MTENSKKFEYNYSAAEQAELKKIRQKYAEPTEAEDKLTRLRRLDASVAKTATTVSLALGLIGILILGVGMSLCMSDFGEILGSYRNQAMIVGIVVGVIGAIIASLAYPVYNAVVRAKRKKLAPEIIRLADELMK